MLSYLHALFGCFVFIAVCYALSEKKHSIRWSYVLLGLCMQWAIAFILLKVSTIASLFHELSKGVDLLFQASQQATGFVFGYLATGDAPYKLVGDKPFIFAFQALPMLIVICALSSLLFYWRVLPFVIRCLSSVLSRVFGLGGALGLAAVANLFIGMAESPLVIRPYLKQMTRSEVFSLMTCGMAGVAGSMMMLYTSILGPLIPNVLGHIVSSVIISLPAALTISRIIVPETEPITEGRTISVPRAQGSLDAVVSGIFDGAKVMVSVIIMLIGFLALIDFMNLLLNHLPHWGGYAVSLQRILGVFMAPVAWLIGIPWNEAQTAGALLGTKIILNEVVAYQQLLVDGNVLTPRVRLIMLYSLCGFANFGSIGIMIGVYGTLVPERRQQVLKFGLRAVIAGTISTCMTGAVVGCLI